MHPIKHFLTITHHRYLVMVNCFRLGLYWQGLTHDLSKYSPTEFWVGAKYFTGVRSPNDGERKDKGYSSSWLHHKGRNKHHLEYWIDYAIEGDKPMDGLEMPVKYVAEMFCDRIAASKVYRKEAYQDSDPYDYFMRSRHHYLIHPKTEALLLEMLTILKDKGEEEALRHIRKEILKR
jgi:hypothetical protein